MKKSMAILPNQSKRPQTHSSCVTQLGDIIDANLSGYERSYDQRVHSIMGNDVYDIASRPEGKSVVSSIWIFQNKCTKQGSWFASERIDYDIT